MQLKYQWIPPVAWSRRLSSAAWDIDRGRAVSGDDLPADVLYPDDMKLT